MTGRLAALRATSGMLTRCCLCMGLRRAGMQHACACACRVLALVPVQEPQHSVYEAISDLSDVHSSFGRAGPSWTVSSAVLCAAAAAGFLPSLVRPAPQAAQATPDPESSILNRDLGQCGTCSVRGAGSRQGERGLRGWHQFPDSGCPQVHLGLHSTRIQVQEAVVAALRLIVDMGVPHATSLSLLRELRQVCTRAALGCAGLPASATACNTGWLVRARLRRSQTTTLHSEAGAILAPPAGKAASRTAGHFCRWLACS